MRVLVLEQALQAGECGPSIAPAEGVDGVEDIRLTVKRRQPLNIFGPDRAGEVDVVEQLGQLLIRPFGVVVGQLGQKLSRTRLD